MTRKEKSKSIKLVRHSTWEIKKKNISKNEKKKPILLFSQNILKGHGNVFFFSLGREWSEWRPARVFR